MATLRQLIQGTQKLHPKGIKWAPDGNNQPLLALEIQEFTGLNSVLVTSSQKMSGRWPKGERQESRRGIYTQTMRFSLGVLNLKRRAGVGESKPSITKDKVSVRCQCDNYYYMWWWGNKKVKAHEGAKFKPYKKVPGSNKEPVNPKNIPGVCKHLVYLTAELRRKKVID